MAHGIFFFSPAEAKPGILDVPKFGIAAVGRGVECNLLFEASSCEPSSCEPSPQSIEGLLGSDDEAQRRILLTSCTELPGELPFFGSNAAGDRYYASKRHQSKT